MAAPTPFDRQTSFALYSAENPGDPHSGADLDTEFNAVKVALDETQANLARIQDADGSLARGSVGRAQLDGSLVIGFNAPSAWETATEYDADEDTVFKDLKFYICLVDHTSGTFSTDLAAGKWRELADFTVENLLDDGSVTTAKLADFAVTAAKLGTGAVTTAKINDLAVTPAKMSSAAAFANEIIPAGIMVPYGGNSAPTGWVFANGQAVSRATYATLFGVYGATFGSGDGSTTFNVPDTRGRAVVGVDGGAFTALGTKVGANTVTVAQANLPAVNLSVAGLTLTALTVTGTLGDVHRSTAAAVTVTDSGGGTAYNVIRADDISKITPIADLTTYTFGGNVPLGGSGNALSIVQPSIACNWIIKAH